MMYESRSIDPKVLDFFAPWLVKAANGSWAFEPHGGIAGVLQPIMVRQHLLFYSPLDVLCFCHFQPKWLQRPGSCAFSAIGYKPVSGRLQELKRQLPNARTLGIFDNDLCGKVLDCKVALWLMGRDADFSYVKDMVNIEYRDKRFRIPEPKFSLHRFRMLTGIRSGYRTVKPKGFVSFTAMLSQR
ncbi:hypothetical protein [Sphingobacterium kitahiroshimense]|uniref:Uncharacterized protein n=1 Tax=Sphingobacterium kitahiroshimense TaxID=470446 RepID=A0ABV0BMB6_9SPHI